MNHRNNHVLVALSVALGVNSVSAENLRVPMDWPTIQIAIEQAEQGDTIILAPGTYFEAINVSGKRITIQSEDPLDPATVEGTIINGFDLGTVVTLLGSEDEQTFLRGVVVRGGQIGVDGNGARATIERCIIEDNNTGILDLEGSLLLTTIRGNTSWGLDTLHAEIEQCVVEDNGLGVLMRTGAVKDSTFQNNDSIGLRIEVNNSHDPVTIERSEFRNNGTGVVGSSSGSNFAGVVVRQSVIEGNRGSGLQTLQGVFENLLIVGNRQNGLSNCDGTIISCTVAQNVNSGIVSSEGLISHIIFWGNGTSISSSTTPVFSGTFNPLFVEPGAWSGVQNRWISGDYHVAADSPYIDAGNPSYPGPGDPAEDLDGNPRVAGDRIDIGAYEFIQPCAGPDFDGDQVADACDRDIDGDGVTNSFDPCDFDPPGTIVDEDGRPRADLNLDCAVNLADFRIMQVDFTTSE